MTAERHTKKPENKLSKIKREILSKQFALEHTEDNTMDMISMVEGKYKMGLLDDKGASKILNGMIGDGSGLSLSYEKGSQATEPSISSGGLALSQSDEKSSSVPSSEWSRKDRLSSSAARTKRKYGSLRGK